MRIILNPRNGAVIKDFWYKDVFYFSSKKGEEFKPKMVLRLEDDFAEYLTYVYSFLEITSAKKAKEILEKKDEEYKCEAPGCTFVTDTRIALEGHKKIHEGEELVPMVQGTKKKVVDDRHNFRTGEEEDKRAGLDGPGLEVDRAYSA